MPKTVRKTITHSLVLFIAVGISYLWTQNYEGLTLQLTALIIIFYVFVQILSKRSRFIQTYKLTFDFLLLTTIVYLIVFSTGALYSPLFFLIYFLLFGIALLFEPSAAIILAIISTVFFLLTPRQEILAEMLQLASLYLIAPLASIFGSQYINLLKDEEKIKVLTTEGIKLEAEVKEQEKEVKDWTTGEFRDKLISMWEQLDEIVSDPGLDKKVKDKLQSISAELGKLLESGKEMKKRIEE